MDTNSPTYTLRMAIHRLEVANQAYGHAVGSGRFTSAESEALYRKVVDARIVVRNLLSEL